MVSLIVSGGAGPGGILQAARPAEAAGLRSALAAPLYHPPAAPPAGPPRRPPLPIYMAGVNPRMIQAGGTVGDGLVGHPLFPAEYVREVVRPALARGAERAGRDAPVPIAGYLTCSVDDDRDTARQA